MRIFLFICLSFLLIQPAFAQGLMTPQEATPNAEEEIEELLGKKQKEELSPPKSLNEFAFRYKQRCVKTVHPIIADKYLDLFCSCASNNILNEMTFEEMQQAQYKSAEGSFQRQRMLMFVYAPCIEKPLNTMILNDCVNNVRSKHLMKNIYGTCGCLADEVAREIQAVTPQYIRGAIRRREDVLNPLDLLVNTDDFERKMRHKTKVCLSRFEGIY